MTILRNERKKTRLKGLDLVIKSTFTYNTVNVTTKAISSRPALIKLEQRIFAIRQEKNNGRQDHRN